MGQFSKAQQQSKQQIDDATAAAGGHVRQVTSLDQLLEQINPKLATTALRWGAVYAALEIASAAEAKAVGALNDLDKAAGGTGDAYKQLAGAIVYPKRAFEELAELAVSGGQALRDHAKDAREDADAEDYARAKYQAVREPLVALAKAREQAHAANVEYAKSLGLSKTALQEEAVAFSAFLKDFMEGNQQLSKEDVYKLFGKQIDDLGKRFGLPGRTPLRAG